MPFARKPVPEKHGLRTLIDIGGGRDGRASRLARKPKNSLKVFENIDPFKERGAPGNLALREEKGFAYLRKQSSASAKIINFDFSLTTPGFLKERGLRPNEAVLLTKGLLRECGRVLTKNGRLCISTFRIEAEKVLKELRENGFQVTSVSEITRETARSKFFSISESANHHVFASSKPELNPFRIVAKKTGRSN